MIFFFLSKGAKKTRKKLKKSGKKNEKHHDVGTRGPENVMFFVFFSGFYCDLVRFFSPLWDNRELTSLSIDWLKAVPAGGWFVW